MKVSALIGIMFLLRRKFIDKAALYVNRQVKNKSAKITNSEDIHKVCLADRYLNFSQIKQRKEADMKTNTRVYGRSTFT